MIKDSYCTIEKSSEGLFKDRGSKFISLAFPVGNKQEAETLVGQVKKRYHDARHHCYAYKIGVGDDMYRVNDDGEPSGTAGKPIYGQINSHKLSDILIVVVRYFGGVKLGTGGLINAYKLAADDCIRNATVVQVLVKKELKLHYTYELMSFVMRIVKEEGLDVLTQDFTDTCRLVLNIRLSEYTRLTQKFKDIYGVEVV